VQRGAQGLEVALVRQPVSLAPGDKQQPHRLRGQHPGRFEAVEPGRDQPGGYAGHPLGGWYRARGRQPGQRLIQVRIADRARVPHGDLPVGYLDPAGHCQGDQDGSAQAVPESQRQFPVAGAGSRLGSDRQDDQVFRQRGHGAHGSERRLRPERCMGQRAGVAVRRPRLATVSVWSAGTTAEYSAVQHEGQQYWRNTMGAST
jgi:hypothetical protein